MSASADDYSDEQKRMLAEALGPLPLDEARVQATVQAARRSIRRSRTNRRLAVTGLGLVLVGLAASPWRWSGRDASVELTFTTALDVITHRGRHSNDAILSAFGRLEGAFLPIFDEIARTRQFTPELAKRLAEAVARPTVERDGLDEVDAIAARIRAGGSWTPSDTDALTRAVGAALHISLVCIDEPTQYAGTARIFRKHLLSLAATSKVSERLVPEAPQGR